MTNGNSVDWGVYRIVSTKVGRVNNGRLDIYVDVEVGSGYVEVVD